MEDLKNKIEAILFSVGKKINIEKIAALCSLTDIKLVEQTLNQIKIDYKTNNSPMMLIQEDLNWKLTVRENYLPLVRTIVTDTELSKSITETLAIIAFKYPISQAELIKIRSNKAYEHVKELRQMQFIEKIKRGRTFDIKLTSKFFEYFDLPEHRIKKTFQNYEEVEKVIEKQEIKYEQEKVEIEKQNEELKEQLKEMQMSEDDYMKELDKLTPENIPPKTDSFESNPDQDTTQVDNNQPINDLKSQKIENLEDNLEETKNSASQENEQENNSESIKINSEHQEVE